LLKNENVEKTFLNGQKMKSCFIDAKIPALGINKNKELEDKGILLRVQSSNAICYPSAYIYLPKSELSEKSKILVSPGNWILIPTFRDSKKYRLIREIDCVAYDIGIKNIESDGNEQGRNDEIVKNIENKLKPIEQLYPNNKLNFRLDGKGKLDISVLKVGQGDLILIKFPSGEGIIVDANYIGSIERIRSKICNFFNNKNPRVLLITHKHLDHIRKADKLMDEFNIPELWWGVCEQHPHSGPTVIRVLNNILGMKKRILGINADNIFNDRDFNISLKYPGISSINHNSEPNIHSIITEINWANNKIILGGDLTSTGWNLAYPILPNKIDLLKVPHHCSREGWCYNNISKIKILNSVTSCGSNRKYKHPHCEPLRTYSTCSSHIITRKINNCSVDYKYDKNGIVSINPNTPMNSPRDCQSLECYQNCSRSC